MKLLIASTIIVLTSLVFIFAPIKSKHLNIQNIGVGMFIVGIDALIVSLLLLIA